MSLLTGLAGCAADTAADANGADDATEEVAESEDAITGRPSNFGYFIVTRRDIRRCISPICGGYFVKRVNQATTVCADGSQAGRVLRLLHAVRGIGLSDA